MNIIMSKPLLKVISKGKAIKALVSAKPIQRKLNKTQKNEVKRMLSNKLEHKFVDSLMPYTQMDRIGNFTRISYNGVGGAEIIRGTGENQRVGDRIKPVELELRFSSYYSASLVTADSTHTVRVIVFRWNEDIAGGVPTSGSVLQYTSSGVGAYEQITSPYNHASKQQKDFTIIMDKRYSLGGASSTFGFHKKFKLKGNLDFTLNSDALGGTGHYYVFVSADDATGAHTPSVFVQYHARFIYVDA